MIADNICKTNQNTKPFFNSLTYNNDCKFNQFYKKKRKKTVAPKQSTNKLLVALYICT